jgi:hypothetical protein
MRTTGFDKTTMNNAVIELIIDKIKNIDCPKCHKNATNISIKNGKIRFKTCCDELRKTIIETIIEKI